MRKLLHTLSKSLSKRVESLDARILFANQISRTNYMPDKRITGEVELLGIVPRPDVQ